MVDVRKTIMLALAPIRKSKGQTMSLLILLTVAGALLYLGLTLALNTGNFFNRKAAELNAADIVVTIQDGIFSEADLSYFNDNPKVQTVETVETIAIPDMNVEYAGKSLVRSIVFIDEKKLGGMLSPRFVGEKRPVGDYSVYLPYVFHAGGGFELGDTITLKSGTKDYTLTIAGFFEDIYFGYLGVGATGMILPEYDSFVETLDAPANCFTLFVRCYEQKDAELYNDYLFDKVINTDPALREVAYLSGTYYQSIMQYSTMTMNIISVIIILFSILIVVVALVVAQFRITNSIEDDMANIGSLKAMGYTSRQIISGILTQYSLISFVGCGLGILLSTAISPILSAAFESQNGLVWDMGVDVNAAALAIAVIAASVLLTSLWAARRIRSLHPIIALRGGITTHSFKKNHFPLDTSKGGLGLLLALKSMKLKQGISIAIICMTVTFASSVFMILYYNAGVDNTAFINLIVSEYLDETVVLSSHADPWQTLEDIQNIAGVKNAAFFSYDMVQVERKLVVANITENFDDLTGIFIYEGRSPKHGNEIAIGGKMAADLAKSIGDKITISYQGGTADFYISGLGQDTNNNGWTVQFTIEGARRMNPDYMPPVINVYAEKGTNLNDLCERLRLGLGSRADSVTSVEDSMVTIDTYVNLFFIITVSILSVTTLVIALVLYLIIKTSISRRRRMLGIQKAVGFTTGQLMRQIAVSFMPPVIGGVCLGGVLGCIYANPVFSVLFRSIGIMRTDFIIVPALIVMTVALIGVFAFFVAMAVSWRVRKITAYALVSE